MIERLMELKGNISPYDLGYALTVAVKDRREEIAQILIDAGADVNVDITSTEIKPTGIKSTGIEEKVAAPPLFYALKRRKEPLIYSLLDANANPNYDGPPWARGRPIPVIQIATNGAIDP